MTTKAKEAHTAPTYDDLVHQLWLTNVVLGLTAFRLGAHDKASVDELVRNNREFLARAKGETE